MVDGKSCRVTALLFVLVCAYTVTGAHPFPLKERDLPSPDQSLRASPNPWKPRTRQAQDKDKRQRQRRRVQTRITQDPSVYPKYNPLKDSKCFNEAYSVVDMTPIRRRSLYDDYVKIFKWGLLNPTQSPLYAERHGGTSNRFAGMCIRMAFNDNTINPNASSLSAQQYVSTYIKEGIWTGPQVMETSGGDASLLLCPTERLHPRNNYDQTASRVLHAFQTSEPYPRGPGITNSNGSSTGLIEKYNMSYSDALHNCALAAMTFLTESQSSVADMPTQTLFPQSNAVDQMIFGRLDACYISSDPTQLANVLEFGNKIALCGTAEILPGVDFDQLRVDEWFVRRGMPVGVWQALLGTHTLMDSFMKTDTLRNLGVKDHDYFKDYVGCPFMTVNKSTLVSESGSLACEWMPRCASGTSKKSNATASVKVPWPMTQSDCATGNFFMATDVMGRMFRDSMPQDSIDMYDQMARYANNPGAWIPDCVCGLMHLGGPDDMDCVGPNAVNSNRSNSLFGSIFAQNPHPGTMPSPYVPKPGEARLVGYNSMSMSIGSDGTLASVDPHYQLWKSHLGEEWTDATNGRLIDVAVVGDNQYYGVGTDNTLYQWSSSQWNRIGHDVQSLSASWDGTVITAGLGNNQQIYYKTGYDTNTNWGTMPGVTGAKDVAVVGGGTLYYTLSNGDVYRTTSYDNKGVKVGSNSTNIAASKDGTVVMSTSNGHVFRKARNDNSLEWNSVQHDLGPVLDIAVKDQNNLYITSESNGKSFIYHVFLQSQVAAPTISPTLAPTIAQTPVSMLAPTIAQTPSPTPHPIPMPAPIPVSLSQVGHGARTISAASDGTLATANLSDNLWKSNLGNGWSLVPGFLVDVAVVQNNWYYVIGIDSHIYRMSSGDSWWTQVGHFTVAISASWDDTVTCINIFDGQIWTKVSQGGWYPTSGVTNAKDVALVGGGIMYYIASNGDIYRTTNYSNPGVKVGYNGSKISASRDGTVVAVHTDGTVWQKGSNDDSSYWTALTGITAADVAVVDANTIFIQSMDGNIYRVNK